MQVNGFIGSLQKSWNQKNLLCQGPPKEHANTIAIFTSRNFVTVLGILDGF